ncbi:SDR family oxidoreductase [Nocardioides marinquilinus]
MTYLVTGTSGHLGRLAVLALLERGVAPGDVVATARDTGAIADLADRGVTTRRLDYDDAASVADALEGVDRVLLVSASVPGQRVAQHRTVIEAAAAAGVELLAYTSLLRADSSPLGLAAEHVATERLLAESGVPHVLLRNGWYLENYTENAGSALEHGAVLGAAGEGRISAATRADYAEAAAVALLEGTPGDVHELAGDTSFTMTEYAAALGEAAGREVVYSDLSPADYAAALQQAGLPEPVAAMLADSDAGVAAGALEDDGRALSTLIGRPTTPLADAVRRAPALVG